MVERCSMPPESATSGSVEEEEPQDTDYSSYLPPLTDEVSLLILARTPFSDHPTLRCLSRRHRTVLESGDLYRIRQAHDLCHPIVFMRAGGGSCWFAFSPDSGPRRRRRFRLPHFPSNNRFYDGDKESICAGSHLLVSSLDPEGPTVWRYELGANRWFRGPDMLSKRSLFASASSGSCAFVAGGCAYVTSSLTARVPMNSAEQYDPETRTWRPLPPMHRKRTHCSGFFMNSKFYVVGGEGVNRDDLKCGEFYDPEMNEWVLVEGMLGDRPVPTGSDGRPLPRSQPLVAVVNGCELYELVPCMNALKVYEEEEKRWRVVGFVPVKADQNGGWGVAFKSLGDRLLVVGRAGSSGGEGGRVCACTYKPGVGWELLEGAVGNLDDFVFNCAVMLT